MYFVWKQVSYSIFWKLEKDSFHALKKIRDVIGGGGVVFPHVLCRLHDALNTLLVTELEWSIYMYHMSEIIYWPSISSVATT